MLKSPKKPLKLKSMFPEEEIIEKTAPEADYEVVTTIDKNVSIDSIITTYLMHRKSFRSFTAEISRNRTPGFHPSGMHGACPRQLAFGAFVELGAYNDETIQNEFEMAVNVANDPVLEAIFDNGHLIHFWLQYSVLADVKLKHLEVEVPITELHEKYFISGTADLIIELQDGNKYVVDIKTINTFAFAKLTKETLPPGYLTQLYIYMRGLNIDRGCLLFVNKNDSKRKEFFFTADELYNPEIFETAKKKKKFVFKQSVPKILFECQNRKGKFQSCPFTSLCFQINSITDIYKILRSDYTP